MILVLLSLIIFSIILAIILKLSIRQFVIFLLSVLLCVYIPSARMIRHIYYMLIVSVFAILLIIVILLSKYNTKIKTVIVLTIISLYYRPIYLIANIILTSIQAIRSKKKMPDHWLAKKVTNIYKNCGIEIKTNFHKLKNIPTIFVANYCRDRVENALCILIPTNLAILMQEGFKKVNITNIINKPLYVNGHGKNNFDKTLKQIKNAHVHGNSIFVYINSPSYFDYMTKHKSGIYHIAKKLNITVTPLAIGYVKTIYGTIPDQTINITVGDPFYVDDIKNAKYKIRTFHKTMLKS